jgi:formate transporter
VCPACDRPVTPRGDFRRLPQEVVLGFVDHAEEFLAASPTKLLVLAFAAGSFIAFGAMLSVVLTLGVETPGVSRLLLGVGFSAGFALVILSGAALVTEMNVMLPELFLSRGRERCRRCGRFWIIVLVGNAAGALFVGALLNAADVIGPEIDERLSEILEEKMRFKEMGAEGWFRVVASGVLGNWLVGMAAFLAIAARTIPGKILGILFPVVTFVALGLQHAPANMGYFAAGLIRGDVGVDWGEAIAWNLVPAIIGNLLGAAILVALLFWYTFGHDSGRARALRGAAELVRSDDPPRDAGQ